MTTKTYLGTIGDHISWTPFYHESFGGHLWQQEAERHYDERGREWQRVECWA